VEPPPYVVSGRYGATASVMFVAYSKALDRWYWVLGGGREQQVPEPDLLFLELDYIAKHRLATPREQRKDGQLDFGFEGDKEGPPE